MNKLLVLINNVILIGHVEETSEGVIISKPYSIQNTPDGLLLQPFLEAHTGQPWNEMPLQKSHILSSQEAENNEILQTYLKKISGIETGEQNIILG